MVEQDISRVNVELGIIQEMEIQYEEVKSASGKPNKTDEPFSKMPLRKKVNRKTSAKSNAANSETRKKPHDSLKDRPKESETDESSSDDRYLEDYSTEESDDGTSESEDLSQDFSDEDKLMEYYERKLREHCLVGNVDSCSTGTGTYNPPSLFWYLQESPTQKSKQDSNDDDGSPDDSEEPYNKPLVTNTVKKPNCRKISETGSQQTIATKSIKSTKPANGKNQNIKSILTIPSNRRKQLASSESNRPTSDELKEDFNNHNSSSENDEVVESRLKFTKKFGEPSTSNVATPQGDSSRPGNSSATANDQHYDSNKKVIDYLNRMGETGLTELKRQIGKRNKVKKTSSQSIVEEIHNSTKAHILKNYVSSFANKKHWRTKRKNIKPHNNSTNLTSASESELSEKDLTKDEVVDRILTTSLSGNTERNLTNLMDLWKSTRQSLNQ